MSLMKAILDAVTDERLSALEERLDTARARLVTKLEAIDVLPHLETDEVRQAARSYRVPVAGEREHIIEALLSAEAYRDSGSEPALYDDGRFGVLVVDTAQDNDRRLTAVGVRALTVDGRCLSEPVAFKLHPVGAGPWRVGKRPLFEEDMIGAFSAADAQQTLDALLVDARFVAIHRADRAAAALEHGGVTLPPLPLQDTLTLSRRVFGDHKGTLAASRLAAFVEPDLDDLEATARTVLAAQRFARSRCGGR